MLVPQTLPQFNNRKALVVVTGKQDARFYRISEGIFIEFDNFKIPRPHYSDKEGYFRSRSKGITMSSGAVRELQDEIVIGDFVREFRRHIKAAGNGFDEVYFFTPSTVKKALLDALPASLKGKIHAIFEGNHYKTSPLGLLSRIKNEIESTHVTLRSEEAQKIISKSRTARSVIRGKA
jgi:hypothetical protein